MHHHINNTIPAPKWGLRDIAEEETERFWDTDDQESSCEIGSPKNYSSAAS